MNLCYAATPLGVITAVITVVIARDTSDRSRIVVESQL